MKRNILIKKAHTSDVEQIHTLMQSVYENMDDKALFVCDSLEYIRNQITNTGFGVVATDKCTNKIIGSLVLRFPSMDSDNLGRDIGLKDEELQKVVHMESAVVAPQYRGVGLQSKMLRFAEVLIDTNKYVHFFATVSPENKASLTTMLKNGYEVVDTVQKYGGLTRCILHKSCNV